MTRQAEDGVAEDLEIGAVAERFGHRLLPGLDLAGNTALPAPAMPEVMSHPDQLSPAWRYKAERTPSAMARVTPLLSVFELASLAACRSDAAMVGAEQARSKERDFREAFHVFVELLPVGASLLVDHWLAGNAVVMESLTTQISVGVENDDALQASLAAALEACLAGLSDHLAFRVLRDRPERLEVLQTATAWRVRPQGLPVAPGGGRRIGFAVTPSVAAPSIVFPSPSGVGSQPELLFPPWSGALRRGFRQARAIRRAFHVRLRLRRERLSVGELLALGQIYGKPPADAGFGDSDAAAESHRTACALDVRSLAGIWLASAPDAFRLELEADGLEGAVSETVLRMLARELFPGRTVEILPFSGTAPGHRAPGDLRDVFPLAAGVPPLLPDPALLDALDFPRHYDNPSVGLDGPGMPIGIAPVNGFERRLFLGDDSLSRHTYVIGATGSGKTTLLYRRMRYHLDAGHGLIVQDPHGDCIEQLCDHGVPAWRRNDIVIIDPSDPDAGVGLNPLDFGGDPDPVKVNRVINDLLDVIDETFDMRATGGPSFELFFRNILLLASTAPFDLPGLPPGPPTLMTAVAVLSDTDLRDSLLARVRSSFIGEDLGAEVERFFDTAKRQSGEHSFPNWVTYVSSKLTRFFSNVRIRGLFCRPYRTVDIRHIMDSKGILLVRLDKGALGEQDTRFLGRMISKFVFQAALSRVDLPKEQRTPCHYIVDEFHNFVCRDAPAMLSEVRKYGLSVCVAHQSIHQFDDGGIASGAMLNSILGNCANKIAMRLGLEDAKRLAPLFHPRFDAHTLTQLPNFKAIGQFAVGDRIAPAIVFDTLPPEVPAESGMTMASAEEVRRTSREHHARSAQRDDAALGTPPRRRPNIGIQPESLAASKNRTAILGEMVSVYVRADSETTNLKALERSTKAALSRWRNGAHGQDKVDIAPLAGSGYLTSNGSAVLIVGSTDNGAFNAVVVSGGHGDSQMRGAHPGAIYQVSGSGKFAMGDRRSMPGLLGMDLVGSLDLSLDVPLDTIAADESGVWLTTARELLTGALHAGFHRTLNGSLVFVAAHEEAWRATVCAGGHGFRELTGEKVGESYSLDDAGRFELSAAKAGELAAVVLGQLSGMTLAHRLDLRGTDVPDVLREESLRQSSGGRRVSSAAEGAKSS